MNRPLCCIALFVCVVLLCWSATGHAAPPTDSEGAAAERAFYSANGLLNRGLYELAEAEYRAFLEANPKHELTNVAQYGLGVCLFRLDRYDEAIGTLDSIRNVRDFEYAAEVATIIGQCHLAQREYDDAAKRLSWVVTEQRTHELADDAAALLAESHYYAKNYDAVEETCKSFVKHWSESPLRERVELFRGLADMAQERYEDGIQRFATMQRDFPSGEYADQVTLLLAQCLHHADSLERAGEHYRNVIRSQHEAYVPEALHGLAVLHHQLKELEKSGELLDELLDRYPSHELASSAGLLRGRVWFEQEQFDQAAEMFKALVDQNGPDADAGAYWWGKCELRQGQPSDAVKRLSEAIGAWPDSKWAAEMTYDLAVAQSRAGEPDAAIRTLERFRAKHAEHALMPEAVHLSAVLHHGLEQYDSSLELCREFVRRFDDHPLASSMAFLVGENSFLAQDFEKATATFELFLRDYPDDAQADAAKFREGMSYYYLERFDDAQARLREVARGGETKELFRPALLALGDIEFQKQQWPGAEQFFSDYLTFGPQQTAADDALLKLGIAVYRQDRPKKAVEAFDGLLKFFPESEHLQQATFEKGQALVALDELDDAKASFERTLEIGVDTRFDLHALNHLGVIALKQQQFDAAAKYFARASEAAKTDEEKCHATFQQGQALVSGERFDEAVQAFDRVLKACPKSAEAPIARAQRAIALARGQKPNDALAAIDSINRREFTSLDPHLRAAVLYEKSWSLRELDRQDEARTVYEALLDEPEDIDLKRFARLELAELAYAANEPAESSRLLRELIGSDLQSRDSARDLHEAALYRLGAAEFARDEFENAVESLTVFIATYPESELTASASLLCGESLIKLGSHDQAIKHLTRIVKDHADSEAYPTALLRLGEANASLQFWPRSEEAFSRYLERFYDTDLWYQAQFGIGWARENQEQYEEAIASYRPVVERHQGPTAARAQFQIGECLYAQKNYQEAVRELLKVDILYDYPEWNAAALFEAGKCFEAMHDPVKAREQFQRVVTNYNDTEWAKLAKERLDTLAQPSLPGH